MAALLIDLDGVLYEGDEPIAGAAEVVRWIVAQEVSHLFLTNTTSRPRSALVEKLAGMHVSTTVSRILTPPVAALRRYSSRRRRSTSSAVSLLRPRVSAMLRQRRG